MKWKDKPLLNKLTEIIMILGIVAYFGLSYMQSRGGAVRAGLPQLCISVVLLSLGISYWKIKRKTAIIYFALGIVWLLIVLPVFLGAAS